MRSEKVLLKCFRTGVQLPSSPPKETAAGFKAGSCFTVQSCKEQDTDVRSTGLEPVPVAGHAPQTCAYADSATTAGKHRDYKTDKLLCQAERKNLR